MREKIDKIFYKYASQKNGHIDNLSLRKVLLAANLLPEKLAINEIDIIFTAAKNQMPEDGSKGAYGLSFDGFV